MVIETKYYGPTNTKGARIRAKCDNATRWFNWNYELTAGENHVKTAIWLADSLNWGTEVVTGSMNGNYYHVFKGIT